MDVVEASFNTVISPFGTQFVIPIWQRLYSWDKPEWEALWEDLTLLCESRRKNENAQHFLGAMVTKTTEDKVGAVTRRVLIDGQQRITTLLVLCALLRDIAKKQGNKTVVGTINDYILYNMHAPRPEDTLKLVPTEADRVTFDSVAAGKYSKAEGSESQIGSAYEFFSEKVRASKYKAEEVLNAVLGLKLVTINLQPQDDPNRIFETLNFRGRKLTQSDLIRNYFMMTISPAKATGIYTDYWIPMQNGLGKDTPERIRNLEEFFRHYSVMKRHDFVKEDEMYSKIREEFPAPTEEAIILEMQTMKRFSEYYRRLLFPAKETRANLRRAIERLNRLDVGVSFPFLLKCYEAFESGKLPEDEFEGILKTIESYVVRRVFGGLPTNSLNRLFASLCSLETKPGLLHALKKELTKKDWTAQYWPTDSKFREAIMEFPIAAKKQERCRLILETLEISMGHPEQVKLDKLTIEHVMPENLNDKWKSYLGADAESLHEKYVHTLGNLTLVAGAPNSRLSDSLFAEKKTKWYLRSNVELTKEIAKRWEDWKAPDIEKRAKVLADRMLQIWPRH